MNLVTQVHDELVSRCGTILGADWVRLKKVFDPTQNDFRSIAKGFGVRHGAASPDADATKVFILSHTFDIVLTSRAANRDSDIEIQTRLNELYSKADDIFKDAVRSKLELYFVTHVDGLKFAEPQVLNNGAILLTASIDVRYMVDPY